MSIKVENLINLDRLTQYDGLIKNKIKEHSDIQASDTVSGHVKVDTGLSDTSTNPVQNKAVKNALDSKVPITRTVNGKALSSNISLLAQIQVVLQIPHYPVQNLIQMLKSLL